MNILLKHLCLFSCFIRHTDNHFIHVQCIILFISSVEKVVTKRAIHVAFILLLSEKSSLKNFSPRDIFWGIFSGGIFWGKCSEASFLRYDLLEKRTVLLGTKTGVWRRRRRLPLKCVSFCVTYASCLLFNPLQGCLSSWYWPREKKKKLQGIPGVKGLERGTKHTGVCLIIPCVSKSKSVSHEYEEWSCDDLRKGMITFSLPWFFREERQRRERERM